MLGTVSKIQVKQSRPKKSYGLVNGYDGETYYFRLAGYEFLKEGDEVSFEPGGDKKGLFANKIQALYS